MTHPRRAHRLDANQDRIAAAARACGATVQSLAAVSAGCPDLLVGWHGRNLLVEVKDGEQPPSGRVLTRAEAWWHTAWRGQVAVVETPEQMAVLLDADGRRK